VLSAAAPAALVALALNARRAVVPSEHGGIRRGGSVRRTSPPGGSVARR
jgi:hypothetical protein